MTLTRISSTKNLTLIRYEGEVAIDDMARSVRSRFASEGKHQIYADKRAEAGSYLEILAAEESPNMDQFPYISAEIGISGATASDVANLWVFMDSQWKMVAAMIEQATIYAKAQVRQASSKAAVESIVSDINQSLDSLGTKPPERPKPL